MRFTRVKPCQRAHSRWSNNSELGSSQLLVCETHNHVPEEHKNPMRVISGDTNSVDSMLDQSESAKVK